MRILSALSSAIACSILCVPLGVQADNPRPLRDMIGLGVKFGQGQPLSELGMLVDLQVSWVRDAVDWPGVEPEPGRYKAFPPEFQQRLEFYKAHGIGIVYMLAYENNVAYPATLRHPNDPVQPKAFAGYAAEVARQLKLSGVRFVLEVWNEPHNGVLPKLLGGAWNAKPPSPWVDHYLEMVRETVARVDAAVPGTKVLSDDDMWIIHYWFLEAGLSKHVDGFAFHPYTMGVPEMTAVRHDTDWVQPFTVVDPDASFRSAVRRLRSQGRKKLGRTPEMWITEWGWPSSGDGPTGPMTEDLVATYLPRAFLSAKVAGVDVMCWFSSFDGPDGPMGLTANDGRKRAGYYTFKTLSEQLGSYAFVRQLLGQNEPTTGVQALLFQAKQGRKLAIWNVEPVTRRLRLNDALQDAAVVDAFGKPLSAGAPDESGARWLPIGPAPIYVTVASNKSLQLELMP